MREFFLKHLEEGEALKEPGARPAAVGDAEDKAAQVPCIYRAVLFSFDPKNALYPLQIFIFVRVA